MGFPYVLKAVAILAFVRTVASRTTSSASDLRNDYDFVIVGGGTAGLTIANRLTEDETTTVLVIEAGPIYPYEKEVVVPYFSAAGYMRPLYEWNISTVPQPGLNYQEILCNQAKVLGGASAKHALVFDRPLPGDLNAFTSLGIDGWEWKDVIPFFKKFETFAEPPPEKIEKFGITFDHQCHGYSGPLGVGWNEYIFPDDDKFLYALDAMEIPRAHDPSCNKMGSFICPSSLDQANQSRTDSRTAYYDPIRFRANLDVLYLNQATRILTENHGDQIRATGVEFATSRNATRHVAIATKEVVVSAGALRSPHLLLLSGIGEANRLAQHNITQIVEVPGVGYNLQDQFTVPLFYDAKKGTETSDDEKNSTFMAEQESLYYYNRTGSWTRGYASVFSYLTVSNLTNITGEQPFTSQYNSTFDEATITSDTPRTVAAGYRKQWDVLRDTLERGDMAAWEITFVGGGKILTATHLHPFSRGNVSLASSDPFDNPVVDPRFLDHPGDYEALFEGVRLLRRIAATDSVLNVLQLVESKPGLHVTTNDDLRPWIAQGSATGNHYTGSCAMLRLEEGGVVDSSLRVYGVSNLRVVDASTVTVVPSGHNQGIVYAFAEKAADMIKQDHEN
ncbi:hypothetical protein BDP67DRAFT_518011 [Colletotrichum lupini]|nr:hypothetical protein BDP67DRAFT_518011 [Colletotrichum lupini]